MANKIYSAPETTLVFDDSGGGGVITFTPKNIANNAGRISAQHDLGAGSKPRKFRWMALTKANVAPTVGTILEIYLAPGDGTNEAGNEGTADAALSAEDKKRNMIRIGSVVADKATNTEPFVAMGVCEIPFRYFSVCWVNKFGQTLTNTSADHQFTLTPIPDEVQ